MEDKHKTKDRLIDELVAMRRRVAELEAAKSEFDRLHESLSQDSEKLRIVIKDIMITLASTIDTRDFFKAGHQKRVAELACAIAKEMNLSSEKIKEIELAALIHDIGKVSVSADLLTRPDRLGETEYNIIKNHPQTGYEILEKAEFPHLIARIILQHHERLNGSGYPQGLSGDDIIQEARIMAVADVVEAIASQRSYRKALGIDGALKEITRYKDLLYDADVVNACVRLFNEKRFKWSD
ncbi:MAG: HD domain-containing protein [Deltaproteobacteria bacterium]|nr:HD domain-containing protein [Deltaproteobacteria bacterium]